MTPPIPADAPKVLTSFLAAWVLEPSGSCIRGGADRGTLEVLSADSGSSTKPERTQTNVTRQKCCFHRFKPIFQ